MQKPNVNITHHYITVMSCFTAQV